MGRRGEWENVPDEELCTGEPIAEMAYASVNDTRKAIEAADAAFRSGCWFGLDAETCGAYLHRVADIQGFCMNQGEVCVSTSRLLLNDAIYEPFMEKTCKFGSDHPDWRLPGR